MWHSRQVAFALDHFPPASYVSSGLPHQGQDSRDTTATFDHATVS